VLPPREIVERLGPHPARALGLDLDDEADLFRWLVLACLLGGRGSEEQALAAFRALEAEGLCTLDALARAEAGRVALPLAEARATRPERPALLLTRLARRLADTGPGALAEIGRGADDLDALGTALVGLAPGLGPATALRFLRPLRERWSGAREVPLLDAARAAAQHLAWIDEGDETGAEALETVCRADAEPPDLADLEAALERLGRLACAPGRPERCPLAGLCPVR